MGWENRNGRQYYYRKHRIGSHVFSEYIGNGLLAENAERLDVEKRRQAEVQRERLRSVMEVNAEVDTETEDFEMFCEMHYKCHFAFCGIQIS